MAQFIPIGVTAEELRWIRMLVALLRHSDPAVPELARQALLYLTESAERRDRDTPRAGALDPAG